MTSVAVKGCTWLNWADRLLQSDTVLSHYYSDYVPLMYYLKDSEGLYMAELG